MTAESRPNLTRVILAWAVHAFTASGAVWALLTIFAIVEGDYKMMIVWMIASMLVDGFDGMLARWANVQKYTDGIDGALLDNILDYLNYVFVPAIFFIKADLLPHSVALLTGVFILFASAYQFTQKDAKTEDHHFKGFPSYWNIIALYLLLLDLPQWINFAVLIFLCVMIFVPLKYIYPSRNRRLRTLTLGLTYLYGAVGIWGLILYPNTPAWIVWASFVYVGYYAVLSFIPKKALTYEN
ncbi:MAG: CDP-alcohol phosphatidyltransferase family protein [Anaerolineales bacterium]|nr:CDP-alcohol phosphatidyltransferase family protein [Anaerolineales bacterium]